MKRFIIICFLSLVSFSTFAQWLSESAEGQGTILTSNSNLSFDLAKTDLSFSLSNLNKNSRFFFGGTMSGRNEEGLANLFSRGDFVPSSKLNVFAGWRFSDTGDNASLRLQHLIDKEFSAAVDAQINEYHSRMDALIDKTIEQSNLTDSAKIKLISKDWHDKLKKSAPFTFQNYLKQYQKATPSVTSDIQVTFIINDLLAESKDIVTEFDKRLDPIRQKYHQEATQWVKTYGWSVLIFPYGGIEGSSFKRVDTINHADPSKSFIKEEYRGGFIGLGINFQRGRFNGGITYAYHKTNNFSLLDKTDYTLKTTTVAGSQTLESSKPITAYSGVYSEVEINELNADLSYIFSMDKKADGYAIVDAYLRSNMFTRNKTALPNSFNIGLGGYFFSAKSKFLGGLYVELPDVDDSFEKSKPATDQIIRPALRRITFGVVTKFTLNSILPHS